MIQRCDLPVDFVVVHIGPINRHRIVGVQKVQSDRIPQRIKEILHRQRFQIQSFDLLPIAEDDVRRIAEVAFARKVVVLQRVVVVAFALVSLADLIALLRTRAPQVARMLGIALQFIGHQIQMQRTRAHESFGRIVTEMRTLGVVVADFFAASVALVGAIGTIIAAVTQLFTDRRKSDVSLIIIVCFLVLLLTL